MLPDFSIYNAIASPVFVLTEDENGDVVYVFMNAAGCRRRLCAPSDVIGKKATDLFPGRAALTAYERQCAAWRAEIEMSYEIPYAVGDEDIWFLTRLVPQRDVNGTVTHMVGLTQDITMEKRLEQAHAMTSALVDEMEDFVRFAAHDLRSPIANVKMLTDMLRDGFVDMGDGKYELIQMIEDIAEGALDLITDVLTQSAAVRADTKVTQFTFRNMCENILATLDPARQHRVTLPDVTVEGDYTAIQIIVRNLVDNALKHAGLDEISLQIDVSDQGDGQIAISVLDNGKGFDDPSLAFLQDEDSSAQSGFGLLGLRRLVRARGGQISVEHGVNGTGARVNVEMPGQLVQMAVEETATLALGQRYV
ncbi:PAS domain-containing sensor histidine kinase [uncultured Tateyamaria sp.]|uniref:PAS domain-containing sensor histidine kinase n=1 Tax=Tateyamaria sp. 1078 TaxID=3417464 RepID=UPI00260B5D97|nr:PAS domain-containing sensor histidine kinase [uncultured Tateyamaria sp.]